MVSRAPLAFVVVSCLALAAAGCTVQTGNGGGGGLGGLNGGGGTPGAGTPGAGTPSAATCPGQGTKLLHCNAAKGEYVALDGAERDAIANEMWTVLTGAQCWFLEGSTQQYIFYGDLQYTFWGRVADSKTGGTLQVQSIGRFEDKNAAVLDLRSEPWILVTLDAQTFTLGKYINGQPYIELYRAHNEGRCL